MKSLKETGLICKRQDGIQPVTNIKQELIQHSLGGFEWGYGGSGPSDFALNILHHLLPVGCDDREPVKCSKGECSRVAYELHQRFKWDFIEKMDREGGHIPILDINAWIDEQLGVSSQTAH